MTNEEKVFTGSNTNGLHPVIICKKYKSHVVEATDTPTRFLFKATVTKPQLPYGLRTNHTGLLCRIACGSRVLQDFCLPQYPGFVVSPL